MRPALLILVLAALALGCDSADEPAPDSSLLLPDLARYDWSLESRHVETDSVLSVAARTITLRVADRDASVPGYDGLTELEANAEGDGVGGRSQAWYEGTGARLREVAYASAGQTPVVQPRGSTPTPPADVFGVPYVVAERMREVGAARGASGEDSITVRSDPRVVYELPLAVGAEWTSFTDPFLSVREVVGRATVTVAAGTFDCFVIRTEIDVIEDGETFEWLDYVSPEQGLVLRTVVSTGEYRYEDGGSAGRVRPSERLERVRAD